MANSAANAESSTADGSPTNGVDQRLFLGTQFISTVLDLFDTKSEMSGQLKRVYLMRAAMAGAIIGVFYLGYHGVVAAFDAVPAGEETLKPIGKFLGSFIFGGALVFIYFTKSELLTSNMMIGSIAVYHKRATVRRVGWLLFLCYVGNAVGALVVALLLWGSTIAGGDTGHAMELTVESKLAYFDEGFAGMWNLFIKAIFCNFLINLGMLMVYNGNMKSDMAKILAMVLAVFLFAFLALEHSVANTALFLIMGFQGGVDPAQTVANVAIALLGNFIGGGLLVGIYYAYANDYVRAQRRKEKKQAKVAAKGVRKAQR